MQQLIRANSILLLTFFLVLFGAACKKEVAVTSAVENAVIITDSSTIDPPVKRNLNEEQAHPLNDSY